MYDYRTVLLLPNCLHLSCLEKAKARPELGGQTLHHGLKPAYPRAVRFLLGILAGQKPLMLLYCCIFANIILLYNSFSEKIKYTDGIS